MNDDNGYRGFDLFAILTIAFLIFALPIAACLVFPTGAHAARSDVWSVPRLPGYACPLPRQSPFRYRPSGCAILGRYDVVTLPKAATEVDIWTLNGKHRLSQYRDTYCDCLQWAFSYARTYSAGWDVTNRDVYNYGRTVVTYFWEG